MHLLNSSDEYRYSEEYLWEIENLSWEVILAKLGFTPKKQLNRLAMRCIFHKEKTASLYFLPIKGLCCCRGCGYSGSKFFFVARIKHGRIWEDNNCIGAVKFFEKHFGIKP